MNREEFLNTLEECLQGTIAAEEIRDTLIYYREYFAEEMQNGKSEEEILQSLGNPRLIAHSILDAHEEPQNTSEGYYDPEEETYRGEGELTPQETMRYLAGRVGVILAVVCVLAIAFSLLNVFLPVIAIGLVIYGISRFLRG